MYQTPRHRVFISFHHEDQAYKDWFIQVMGDDIVDESFAEPATAGANDGDFRPSARPAAAALSLFLYQLCHASSSLLNEYLLLTNHTDLTISLDPHMALRGSHGG